MMGVKQTGDSSSTTEMTCPSCGATLPAGLNVCWLCFSPVDTSTVHGKLDQPRSIPNIAVAPVEHAGGFSLASLMMCVTLVCVVLGVFTIAPGLGVPLAIVALITWLRTVSVVKSRAASGAPLTSGNIVLMFVRSVAFTMLVLMLVGVAAVAAFATLCFGLMNAAEPSHATSEFVAPFVVSAIVLIAAILGIAAGVQSQRRRRRRDRGEPK